MGEYKIATDAFAYTSPYGGCWLEHFYRNHAKPLFGEKTKKERHLIQQIERFKTLPELLIMGNFVVERHGIKSLCRELGINTICSEDGFFPHYQTLHADPLGFAWESSLCQMTFRGLTEKQRQVAQSSRMKWIGYERVPLPETIKPPYVLWPLQLIGDQVNRWDMRMESWMPMVQHFRESLPQEIQLVVKPHPRSKPQDIPRGIKELPNTLLLEYKVDLKSLIESATAVAGANSTVLMESRLMFHKPVYAYARSWFTHHTELFTPVFLHIPPRELNRLDYLQNPKANRSEYLNDYTDWFLYQLLVRQLSHAEANDWEILKPWTTKRTYQSFIQHGEDIFQ